MTTATKKRPRGRPQGTTRASRKKLERALVELESFAAAADLEEVTTGPERRKLRTAIASVQALESRLHLEGR